MGEKILQFSFSPREDAIAFGNLCESRHMGRKDSWIRLHRVCVTKNIALPSPYTVYMYFLGDGLGRVLVVVVFSIKKMGCLIINYIGHK